MIRTTRASRITICLCGLVVSVVDFCVGSLYALSVNLKDFSLIGKVIGFESFPHHILGKMQLVVHWRRYVVWYRVRHCSTGGYCWIWCVYYLIWQILSNPLTPYSSIVSCQRVFLIPYTSQNDITQAAGLSWRQHPVSFLPSSTTGKTTCANSVSFPASSNVRKIVLCFHLLFNWIHIKSAN